MVTMRKLALGVCALFLAVPCLRGDDVKSVAAATDPATFVKKASEIHLAEIQVGTLATRRASRADVKEFGQKLTTDHQKAYDELKKLAETQRFPVATSTDKRHQDLTSKLSGLQGTAFDREFLQEMVKGHKEALEVFEAQAASGRDAALKSYAQRCAQTVRDHLRTAEELQAAKTINR